MFYFRNAVISSVVLYSFGGSNELFVFAVNHRYFEFNFQNIMTFNKASVRGRAYGDIIDETSGEPINPDEVKTIHFSHQKRNSKNSNPNLDEL